MLAQWHLLQSGKRVSDRTGTGDSVWPQGPLKRIGKKCEAFFWDKMRTETKG